MLGKLATAFAIVSTATVLSVSGFGGYLIATGQLTSMRMQLVGSVLRGELDTWTPEEHDPEATSQPADEHADGAGHGGPSPHGAAAQHGDADERHSLDEMRIERARADLEARHRLLDQVLQEIVSQQEKLAEKERELERLRAAKAPGAKDDGFAKELEYFSSLKPALAKEHLVRVWKQQPADAIRLMVNVDEGRGRRILEQMKTPEELTIMTDLLEQIRTKGQEFAEASGTTNGTPTP